MLVNVRPLRRGLLAAFAVLVLPAAALKPTAELIARLAPELAATSVNVNATVAVTGATAGVAAATATNAAVRRGAQLSQTSSEERGERSELATEEVRESTVHGLNDTRPWQHRQPQSRRQIWEVPLPRMIPARIAIVKKTPHAITPVAASEGLPRHGRPGKANSISRLAWKAVHNVLSDTGAYFRNSSELASERLRAFWVTYDKVSKEKEDSTTADAVRPDPIGICVGFCAVAFAAYSVYRSKREANRIISLFEANTQVKELEDKARRGEPLPNIVVIRGTIQADGRDVSTVAPHVGGLREKVGEIEQPKNAWIEIARQAKHDPHLKGIADAVVERTGVDSADVPDVPEPGDTYKRDSTDRGEGSLVLSEILVARICAKHQRRAEDKKTKKISIKRPCRNESYNCFHGRRVAEGLHLLDLEGTRVDLDLPAADAVGLAGIPEPPPLFLPVNDVWTEFTHYLRRDGLSGPGGRHQRLDDLPPMRLSDPYTLLSEFIFIDVQSPGDLGGMPGNPNVLNAIAEAYRGRDGPAKFLWEPRGFYDSVKGGGYDDVPAYASARFRRTEMVSASELTERAQVAARQNSFNTPYCEPTFTREQLMQRRDQENCFRYTELAIPRGSPVTVLARPMVVEAGTGEGADFRIRLTSPLTCAEDDGKFGDSDPRADRFRFRIRPGHTVENLLRLRNLNVNAYYGLAVVGVAFAGWAAAGYPGMDPASS